MTFRGWMAVFFGVLGSSSAVLAQGSARCLPPNSIQESEGRRIIKATVARVVDGDTVKARIKGTELSVRFLSIDTPETHYMGRSQGVWGDRAAEALSDLLPVDSKITIELDNEVCDRYGRLLGYVFKGRKNINQAMLENAMAVNYCIAPNLKYCEIFSTIVAEKVAERSGIFGDSSLELPYEWRRIISDRPFEKFLGDIHSHEVLGPGPVDRVPVADRVFFFEERDIRKPYFKTF